VRSRCIHGRGEGGVPLIVVGNARYVNAVSTLRGVSLVGESRGQDGFVIRLVRISPMANSLTRQRDLEELNKNADVSKEEA